MNQIDCERIRAGEISERPVHPEYGRALGGRPHVVDGVVLRPYRTGILRAVWISDDGRITVNDSRPPRARRAWFWARLDGELVGDRFATFGQAARAAIAKAESQ
jgi:hypothetical protein